MLTEYDKNGNKLLQTWKDGYSEVREFDEKNRQIWFENNKGQWQRNKFDTFGHETLHEDSTGFKAIRTFDNNGDFTSYKNSDGLYY